MGTANVNTSASAYPKWWNNDQSHAAGCSAALSCCHGRCPVQLRTCRRICQDPVHQCRRSKGTQEWWPNPANPWRRRSFFASLCLEAQDWKKAKKAKKANKAKKAKRTRIIPRVLCHTHTVAICMRWHTYLQLYILYTYILYIHVCIYVCIYVCMCFAYHNTHRWAYSDATATWPCWSFAICNLYQPMICWHQSFNFLPWIMFQNRPSFLCWWRHSIALVNPVGHHSGGWWQCPPHPSCPIRAASSATSAVIPLAAKGCSTPGIQSLRSITKVDLSSCHHLSSLSPFSSNFRPCFHIWSHPSWKVVKANSLEVRLRLCKAAARDLWSPCPGEKTSRPNMAR